MKIDEDPAPVGTHGTARCKIEKLQSRAVREAEMPSCRETIVAAQSSRVTGSTRGYLRVEDHGVFVKNVGTVS